MTLADRAARSHAASAVTRARARWRAARQHVRRASPTTTRRRRSTRRGTPASASSTPRRSTGTGCRSAGSAARCAATPRDEYVLATKVGRLLRAGPGTRSRTIFRDVARARAASSTTPATACCARSRRASTRLGARPPRRGARARPRRPRGRRARRTRSRRWSSCATQGVVARRRLRDEPGARCSRGSSRGSTSTACCSPAATRCSTAAASELLAQCAERGVGVILGGVFNSGVLADPDAHPTYDYAAASSEVLERARRLRRGCDDARGRAPGRRAAVRHAPPGRHHRARRRTRSAAEVALDVGFAAASPDDDVLRQLSVID